VELGTLVQCAKKTTVSVAVTLSGVGYIRAVCEKTTVSVAVTLSGIGYISAVCEKKQQLG